MTDDPVYRKPSAEANKPVQPPKGVKVQKLPSKLGEKFNATGAIQFGLQRGRVTR
jgi:hypothetical protein